MYYGSEFTSKMVRGWLGRVGVKPLFIQPGSPWENGYNESFKGKLRGELQNREIFYSLKEVQILAKRWRREYCTSRPHSLLGYRPPVPETIMPGFNWSQIRDNDWQRYRGQVCRINFFRLWRPVVQRLHAFKAKITGGLIVESSKNRNLGWERTRPGAWEHRFPRVSNRVLLDPLFVRKVQRRKSR